MCITSILLHVYEPIRNATGKLTAQKQKVVGIRNEKKLNELRFRKKIVSTCLECFNVSICHCKCTHEHT